MLRSEWDARWPDVGTWGSHKAEIRVQGDRVGTEVHYKTGVTLGLACTPSMITLECLDKGDKRGEG